jgi:prepilin-type N-terminal cleavage/methylation domain-containing protein
MAIPTRSRSHRQQGYTLIELMVSSVILGLAVAGTTTLWRNGREFEQQGDVRRQAFQALVGAMEAPEYHFSRYAAAADWSGTVLLDSGTTSSVTANLSLAVSPEESDLWGTGVDMNQVHYRSVTGRITWSLAGKSDSLKLKKRLVRVKY